MAFSMEDLRQMVPGEQIRLSPVELELKSFVTQARTGGYADMALTKKMALIGLKKSGIHMRKK